MSYSWRFHNFLNLFCFYSYFPIFVSNAVYLCPVCFSCLNWPKISIFITLFKVIFCLCWSLLLFVCLFVFYFIQILLLSLSFPIFLVWFCLHPNWSFHPYIDIYILQIPQIQHLQMEFQLLTKHALLPPRFLSMVLHHHFTKQSPEECVQLLFSSHFSHPFVYHFRLFSLWNISQVWTYCYCADSDYHHCFLGEWQPSLLISFPDCQHCLPNLSSRVTESEDTKTMMIIFKYFKLCILCNFKGQNESQ